MDLSLSLTVIFSSYLEAGLYSSSATSRADCIIKCFYANYCNSVFYESTTSVCHLCSSNYNSPTISMESAPGVVYIVVKSGNLAVVGPEAQCPADFTYNRTLTLCYRIQDSSGTSNQHRLECEAFGGHLIAVASSARDNFVDSLTNSYGNAFFIGAFFDGSKWKWANGVTYGDYLNWADGYPAISDSCARKNRGDPQWKSFDCDKGSLHSVCEYPTTFSHGGLLTLCVP